MFVICTTSGKVLSAKFENKADALVAAKDIAVGQKVAVKVLETKVTVRKAVVAKPDHHVYMALGKKSKAGTRKILRVGTAETIKAYCMSFVKKNGYCPSVRIAPANCIVGSRI